MIFYGLFSVKHAIGVSLHFHLCLDGDTATQWFYVMTSFYIILWFPNSWSLSRIHFFQHAARQACDYEKKIPIGQFKKYAYFLRAMSLIHWHVLSFLYLFQMEFFLKWNSNPPTPLTLHVMNERRTPPFFTNKKAFHYLDIYDHVVRTFDGPSSIVSYHFLNKKRSCIFMAR